MPLKAPHLRTIRRLTEAFQAFEALTRAQLRSVGLTHPQFDIIATLGNTAGMSFRELGDATLITKGTLTGVIDRLERDGMVERMAAQDDGRRVIVRLTPDGDRVFESIFPAVVSNTGQAFKGIGAKELETFDAMLTRLRDAFTDRARTEAGLDAPPARQVGRIATTRLRATPRRASSVSTGRSGGSAPAVIPFKGSRR